MRLDVDPVQFRLMHITRLDAGRPALSLRIACPRWKCCEEGAKAFGWEKRNPVAGGAPGRFKRGFGLGMSQHHGGLMGYHEGEEAFAKLAAAPGANIFSTELELGADGNVTMKIALPDSGSNAATALAHLVAEMLGFTTRDHIRLIWGDSDIAPSSDEWFGGRTITLQGAAICSAADKLRKDLLARAADAAEGRRREASRFATASSLRPTIPKRARPSPRWPKPTTASSAKPAAASPAANEPRSNKGVGACFVEVEVDTWTGNWRFVRAVYTHDTGLRHQPAGVRSRHGRFADRKHAGRHRPHSLGPRISRHAALQRRLPVLPASDDHGHSEIDAGLHRQPGAALVLRREELQRNQHRRRAGRDLQRDLQRLRRPHSRASHHAGKDHGRA